MFGLGNIEILVILAIIILPFVLWFWGLIDILKSEFTGSNKVIWLLMVLFLPGIGLIAYYFIGRGQKVRLAA